MIHYNDCPMTIEMGQYNSLRRCTCPDRPTPPPRAVELPAIGLMVKALRRCESAFDTLSYWTNKPISNEFPGVRQLICDALAAYESERLPEAIGKAIEDLTL